MKTEKAKKKHLGEIIEVVKHSIMTLCHPDHLNKPENLQAWLSARSGDNLAKELFASDSLALICRHRQHITGVVCLHDTGELTLCYVHPRYIGRGIGRLLLQAAEAQAREWGLKQIHLISTRTAREFYVSQGFERDGEEICHIGMPGYPLAKRLQS